LLLESEKPAGMENSLLCDIERVDHLCQSLNVTQQAVLHACWLLTLQEQYSFVPPLFAWPFSAKARSRQPTRCSFQNASAAGSLQRGPKIISARATVHSQSRSSLMYCTSVPFVKILQQRHSFQNASAAGSLQRGPKCNTSVNSGIDCELLLWPVLLLESVARNYLGQSNSSQSIPEFTDVLHFGPL
jgi:hypothetical protein